MGKIINPDETVEELLEKYPSMNYYLSKKGIVCVVCGEPVWGTLRELLNSKGIENIEEFVNQMEKDLKLS